MNVDISYKKWVDKIRKENIYKRTKNRIKSDNIFIKF